DTRPPKVYYKVFSLITSGDFIRADHAQQALDVMRSHPLGQEASLIGLVTDKQRGLVTVRTPYGSTRILDMISGEQLPRIC
ncbi:MAG: hypothetical protein V2A61_05710, partial [Calditrichota bacterium]